MADEVYKLSEVKPEELKKLFDMAKSLIKIGKGVSSLTGTTVDDKVLTYMESAIVFLEPLSQKEGFLDMVNLVVKLLDKEDKVVTENMFKLLQSAKA